MDTRAVKGRHARLARYRSRSQVRHRWPSYVGLAVLIGLVGGLSLAGVAAARTTQSSFPAFLASTNPSDINIDNGTWDPSLLKTVRTLAGVTSVQSYVALNMAPVKADGSPDYANPFGDIEPAGTLQGLFLKQDKVTIVSGRMLDPHTRDQIVVSRFAADTLHLHLGQRIREGVFTNSQLSSGEPDTPAFKQLSLDIVGIGIFNDEVVQDDVDRIPRMVVSPALADQLAGCCGSYAWTGVQLKGGAAAVQPFLREYLRRLPASSLPYIHITSVIEEQAEQSVKPESLALGVFGLIAGLAVLIIASQSMGRQVRLLTTDREILRSIGADPVDTTVDGLWGLAGAVVVGSLLATGVALLLSPLAPFGAVRQVEPNHRISADWTVLGFGTAAMLVLFLGMAVLFSYRDTPHRVALRRRPGAVQRPALVRLAVTSGLPLPASTGVQFALETGRGRSAVPVRSIILGTVLAVVVVMASLTFGSSLNTLVSHPSLYGWNWQYILESNAGYGDMPASASNALLARDHDIVASTGGYYSLVTLDGQSVPVLGENPGGPVQPSILAGHGFDASDQVVLGTETLQRLHKHIGQTVTVGLGAQARTVTIVGTATMPTVGVGHGLHLSMGTGAVLDEHLIPAFNRNIQQYASSGPNVYLVRTRPGVSPASVGRSLQHVGDEISTAAGQPQSVDLFGVQHPGQIVNYRSMGSTPALLAGALSLGVLGAIGLTLGASVRRRRRDLALLKTLGFTHRQLSATVSWQASISVGIGTLIGIPLGIALGRFLWTLFANELYAVPHPTVSVLSVIAVAVGALVLANLVALAPARRAARAPTSLVLRSE